MDVIALRKTSGTITGEVKLNGHQMDVIVNTGFCNVILSWKLTVVVNFIPTPGTYSVQKFFKLTIGKIEWPQNASKKPLSISEGGGTTVNNRCTITVSQKNK